MDPRPTRAGLLFLTLASCAFGASAERQQEEARLREQLVAVQEAACVKATAAPGCAPRGGVLYQPRLPGLAAMRCGEDGVARVEHDGASRPMPPAVWEAIARVVVATDGCINSRGERVNVVWPAKLPFCADPRFDVHELLDLAYDAAEEGPTEHPRVVPPASSKCPPFTGRLWPVVESAPVGEPAGPR